MPRNKKATVQKRKSAASKKTKTTKAAKQQAPKKCTSAGKNRAEGIRLFNLAGRPSKQDFIKVYGENGPKWNWTQRAKAGVPAEKFQAALAAKHAGR